MAKAPKKPSSVTSNSAKNEGIWSKWAIPVLVLVAIAAVAVVAYHANKGTNVNSSNTVNNSGSSDASSGSSNTATGSGSLAIDPGTQSVANGSEVTMSIYEDSGKDAVNAVQANVTYPTDKFDFVKIDTTGSAFAIKAQEDGGGGTIKIARGTINPVTAKQLVAKVVFKAKAGSGKASIGFADGSGIVRSSDNKEILQQSNGGTYTLTQ